eukprot:scaffold661518_cov60-Prasinocladus_malaysianus.AAC.1
MLPEARAMLEEFYHPWNLRLSGLLRDKRFLWLKPETKHLSVKKSSPALRARTVSGSLPKSLSRQ